MLLQLWTAPPAKQAVAYISFLRREQNSLSPPCQRSSSFSWARPLHRDSCRGLHSIQAAKLTNWNTTVAALVCLLLEHAFRIPGDEECDGLLLMFPIAWPCRPPLHIGSRAIGHLKSFPDAAKALIARWAILHQLRFFHNPVQPDVSVRLVIKIGRALFYTTLVTLRLVPRFAKIS